MNAKEFTKQIRNITGYDNSYFNVKYMFRNKNNNDSFGCLIFRDEDLSPYVEIFHDGKTYYYNFNSEKNYGDKEFLNELAIISVTDKIKLEVAEDVLSKISSIVNNTFFDTRITITLDMTEKEIYTMMEQAHEKDMTLNKYVEYILQKVIDKENDF